MRTVYQNDNGFTVTRLESRGIVIHECATRGCTMSGRHMVDHVCNTVRCTYLGHR